MSYRSTMDKANKGMEIVGKAFAGAMVAGAFGLAGWIVWFVWAASTGNLPS